MAILIFSIIILFTTFTLGELTRVSIIPTIAISGLDIAVFIFISIIAAKLAVAQKIKFPIVWKGFVLFVAFAFLSLILGISVLPQNQILASVLYLLRFILYSLIFFTVVCLNVKEKQKILIGMVVAGSCMEIAGFVQFIFYPSLRNLYYAGWDEHLYRMFGTFLDPNFFGIFLVLYILLLIFLLINNRNLVSRIIYSGLLFVTFCAIFLTYSRSALLSLIAGTSVFLFLIGKKKIVAYAFISLVIIGSIFFFLTGSRSEGTNLFRTTSTQERLTNMQNALSIWSDNVFFGVGFNAYRYAQYRHGFIKVDWEEGHGSAGADNSFLFILATTGLFGFIAFLYFGYQHVIILKRESTSFYALGISTIAALSVGSFFVNGLFYPPLMLWLWLVLGIIENM